MAAGRPGGGLYGARSPRGQFNVAFGYDPSQRRDEIAGSITQALAETSRRREKQIAYNKEHNITPQSIKRAISNILETIYGSDHGRAMQAAAQSDMLVMAFAEEQAAFNSPDAVRKRIADLEKRMKRAAANLEFEEAASLRDQLKKMEQMDLSLR